MPSIAILRAAAVALVAGLSVAAAGGPAAAHHPELLRPFGAKHDDGCTSVWTEGNLSWKAWHAPDTPGVNVRGEVGARQRQDCAYLVPVVPFADFTAYVRDDVVDHRVVKVDWRNPTPFQLVLEADWATIAPVEIDRVEVRACVVSSLVHPPPEDRDRVPEAWCGEPDVHHRLSAGPA